MENSYGQLVARMMQIQNQGSDLDSNSKYRKELQALQSEYEDVVSRLNQLESEPNKTQNKNSNHQPQKPTTFKKLTFLRDIKWNSLLNKWSNICLR